jgi:hypothetical protein
VDTWFYPVIQAGVLGIKEEEAALDKLWAAVRESHEAGKEVEVDLTSGYFGLYKAYKRAVIDSPTPVRILAASPKVSNDEGLAENRRTGSMGPRASPDSFRRVIPCSNPDSTGTRRRPVGSGTRRGERAFG